MDNLIDPATQDYTLTEAGDLATTDSGGLQNAAYLRLETPLGSWWPDPTLGSKLYTLKREKDVPRVQMLAVQYAEEALQPLLDDGRCTAIDVTALRESHRLYLMISLTAASGEVVSFKYFVQVI